MLTTPPLAPDPTTVATVAAPGRFRLDDTLETLRGSHTARLAIRCAGVIAGSALAVGLGITVAAIPLGIGAIATGVVAVVATGLAAAAVGGAATRRLPAATVSGSSGLRRLAIGAAVAGVIGLVAGAVALFIWPDAMRDVGAAAAIVEAGLAGSAAASVVWDRFADNPLPAGSGARGLG